MKIRTEPYTKEEARKAKISIAIMITIALIALSFVRF